MVLEVIAGCGLGSLIGLRHVLEPDHLAAVSALVTGQRTAHAAWLGALWGLGHSLTLLTAGAVLIAWSAEMPASASWSFELAVAAVMIAIGLRAACQGLAAERLPPQSDAASMLPSWSIQPPFVVGAIHGLAGSGPLVALVMSAFPSTASRVAYLLSFGLGSIVGMATLSGVLVVPMARVRNRRAAIAGVLACVGGLSIVLGLVRGYAVVGQWFAL